MTTVGTLYAGVGGADLGFAAAGYETRWQAEADPFRRAVLARRFPETAQLESVEIMRGVRYPADLVYMDLPDWRIDRWWSPAWPVVLATRPTWLLMEFSPTVRYERVIRDVALAEWSFRVVFVKVATSAPEIGTGRVHHVHRQRSVLIASPESVRVESLGLLAASIDLEAHMKMAFPSESIEGFEAERGLPPGWTCACAASDEDRYVAAACCCDRAQRERAAGDATVPILTGWLAQLLDGRWTDGRGLDRGLTQADGVVHA